MGTCGYLEGTLGAPIAVGGVLLQRTMQGHVHGGVGVEEDLLLLDLLRNVGRYTKCYRSPFKKDGGMDQVG